MGQGYPCVVAAPGWFAGVVIWEAPHAHQGVAEGDAAAPVGARVVGERVGHLAVGVMVAPPSPRDRDHTTAQPSRHPHRHAHRAAVVVHLDHLAVDHTQGLGIGGDHLDERTALERTVLGQVASSSSS